MEIDMKAGCLSAVFLIYLKTLKASHICQHDSYDGQHWKPYFSDLDL
jgi:hypothetical protein